MLLFGVSRRQNAFMTLLKEPMVWVYFLQNQIDIVLKPMRVNIKSTERFQKLEHLLNAIAHNKGHFSASLVVKSKQMGIAGGTRHHICKVPVESVD